MHRRLQFGMRENPASDRRHGSRAALTKSSNSHFIGEENTGALEADMRSDPATTGGHAREKRHSKSASHHSRRSGPATGSHFLGLRTYQTTERQSHPWDSPGQVLAFRKSRC